MVEDRGLVLNNHESAMGLIVEYENGGRVWENCTSIVSKNTSQKKAPDQGAFFEKRITADASWHPDQAYMSIKTASLRCHSQVSNAVVVIARNRFVAQLIKAVFVQ
ncbi:hypothetical protein [Endozoicomonas numazuensis]|uniref:Uncharacterized protein n=1 Tax=Endozoicomonas numazuensis TaxID=1137799 RepID=A0A081NKL6_9GAMM|nr:hypothetical protein [Endozoicomonas numazuensis]KEQ18989.1 hypothetical protein GZ78_02805 [Endozoicomonas numazuensis]